jgi:hypothetical protein
MPKPPEHLNISQEAFERLLLQERWLSTRPEFCSGLIAMDTLMGGLSTCRGEIDEREAQEV